MKVLFTQSFAQRLWNYWLCLRLQDMDIPDIHLLKASTVNDSPPLMIGAVNRSLRIKDNDHHIFNRKAQHNCAYGAKLLGNRPITSYACSGAT